MSRPNRGVAASHLPPEVAVRVVAHRMADRRVSVDTVDGVTGVYDMRASSGGSGQEAAYEFATRMADRAFVDSEIIQERAPDHDGDDTWGIRFSFVRSPADATWDNRIFNAGNFLFQVMGAKSKDKLGKANGWITGNLRANARLMRDLHGMTGNPVMSAAAHLMKALHDETPSGIKAAKEEGREPNQAVTWERTRQVGRMTAAALLDMLDMGHARQTERPGRPEEDIREWRHLWLMRNCCLTALSLKEDGTLSRLGEPDDDGMTRALLMASAGLRDLADDEAGERAAALSAGHRAMTRLIGEIGFAREGRRVPAEMPEEDAEADMLDAADTVLEIIEERFPPVGPSARRHGDRPEAAPAPAP